MVRAELMRALAVQHPDLPAQETAKIVTAFFDAITERLASGGRVDIRGLGAFTTRARDARIGRNPRNGDTVAVAARRVPHFKPGKELRERINRASVL